MKVTDELSLGAGFISGLAIAEFITFAEATSPPVPMGEVPSDNFSGRGETRSKLNVFDPFLPGVVVSALWTPSRRIELAGWFKWIDAIESSGDLYLQSLVWDPSGKLAEDPCAGQPADCNVTDPESKGEAPAAQKFRLAIPMEAKLGFRYRHPHPSPKGAPKWINTRSGIRDSLSQDLFDVEANFTWANNSSVQALELQFRPGIPVAGTPGFVPQNANRDRNWKDVFGVRVGGDVTVVPNLLALRTGGFYETQGADPRYLSLDFHNGWKAGIGGGGVVRLGPVDVAVSYQHTFFGALDNCKRDANDKPLSCDGQGFGLSGDIAAGNKTRQATNGGRLTSDLNEVGLSATLRL